MSRERSSVCGRVQREREPDRLRRPRRRSGGSPGSQPTVEIVVPAVRDAELRQPPRRAEHVVEVEHRLAHAHEDRVVDGLDRGGSGAPGRGSRRRSGCGRTPSGRSRRTCRSAGSRTARRGRATGARRGSASAPPRPDGRRRCGRASSRVPSRASRSVSTASVEKGTLAASSLAQRARQVRHRVVPGRAARRPTPTPGRPGRPAAPRSASVVSRRSRSTRPR